MPRPLLKLSLFSTFGTLVLLCNDNWVDKEDENKIKLALKATSFKSNSKKKKNESSDDEECLNSSNEDDKK